jgi:hypothetical protein
MVPHSRVVLASVLVSFGLVLSVAGCAAVPLANLVTSASMSSTASCAANSTTKCETNPLTALLDNWTAKPPAK